MARDTKLTSTGIIHNDIKLANIVQEKDGRYKIIDYGLSFGESMEHLIEANITRYQLSGTFRTQTLVHDENRRNMGRSRETPIVGTNVTKFNQLTPEAKKSIDLWAFVICILETVGIYSDGRSRVYPNDRKNYDTGKTVLQKERFRTAESLLRDVKRLNESANPMIDDIVPDLGKLIEDFLTLNYNKRGEVITYNKYGREIREGEVGIPNDHWNKKPWEDIFELGNLYHKLALRYQKAAEQGDPDAQFNLGVCYENGEGVENHTTAAEW